VNPGNVVDHTQNQARDRFSPSIAPAIGNISPNVEQGPDNQVYDMNDVSSIGTPLHSDPLYISGPQDLNEHVIGEELFLMPSDVPPLSSPMVTFQQFPQRELSMPYDIVSESPFGDLINWPRSPSPLIPPIHLEFRTHGWCNLDALPFKKFMKDLRHPGT